jgi:hypothetical protein
MKISYKKRHLNINLIFGISWLIFGLLGVFLKEKPYWTDYVYIIISILFLIIHFYKKKEKYLTIENGFIKQNWPFGKKMELTEINRIKHFAGDYILKSDKTEMTINIQLIEEKSINELKTELNKLNAEWI